MNYNSKMDNWPLLIFGALFWWCSFAPPFSNFLPCGLAPGRPYGSHYYYQVPVLYPIQLRPVQTQIIEGVFGSLVTERGCSA